MIEPACDQELLADRDDLEQLGRIGVEVDHVGRLLGRRRAAVHGQPDIGLGKRRRVVRAVAGHRQQVAFGLLLADEADLLLGSRLRDEVVDTGFLGDRRRGARVVAGDHHRPDAHLAELGEALDEPFLDRVLELDHAQDATLGLEDQRGGPLVGDAVGIGRHVGGQAAHLRVDRVDRTLQDGRPRRRPDAARARLGAERDLLRDGRVECRVGGVVAGARRATELGQPLAHEVDDRAPLRGLIPDRGDEGGVEDLGLGDARARV